MSLSVNNNSNNRKMIIILTIIIILIIIIFTTEAEIPNVILYSKNINTVRQNSKSRNCNFEPRTRNMGMPSIIWTEYV